MVEDKKRKVDSAVSLHNYGLECDETEAWIKEKTRVIESTQDLGNDLAAVITIQRKLFGMERDLAAIEAKLTFLKEEAEQLAHDHPENAVDILAHRRELDTAWDRLRKTLKDREDSLGEVSKLQTFLQDMDDFQSWLFKTQKAVASEEIPTSLQEAEELLSRHNTVREDINNHEEDYHRVRDTGAQVIQGQEDDPQYQQLEQRLKGLDRGWYELQKMWDSRKHFLDQGLGFQQFLRDGKAVEAILNNQDTSYDEARNLHSKWLKHQAFMAELASNKDWLNKVDQEGQELMESKPEFEPIVKERLAQLHELWDKLESTTQEKDRLLFDANRSELFDQSLADMKKWLAGLQQQLQSGDEDVKDLTNANILLKKHQVCMVLRTWSIFFMLSAFSLWRFFLILACPI
ncbi:hypothetical protein GOODEAATRI_014030 [Goodea atripinnis]|uniref:Spectrin alpha chain-like protein n=1 Tax=Goodea atripinnis TaxID=208336 RepID=A0ABV0PYL8_9TELE